MLLFRQTLHSSAASLPFLLGLLFQLSVLFPGVITAPLEESLDHNSRAIGTPSGLMSVPETNLQKRYEGRPWGKIGNTGPVNDDYPSDDTLRGAYISDASQISIFYSNTGTNGDPEAIPLQYIEKYGGRLYRHAFQEDIVNTQGSSE